MNTHLELLQSELAQIESTCEKLSVLMHELAYEIQEGELEKSQAYIRVIFSLLEGIPHATDRAQDQILLAELTQDEPRPFELYPYPDSLAELMAAESALGNLGFRFWGD